MDMALYASLVSFVIVMSITPGPNNLMMMSSSALFGVRATLPHWLGVNIGFNIMMVAAVFGLGQLVEQFSWTLLLVKIGGSVWLAWMAWLFLSAGLKPTRGDDEEGANDTESAEKPGSRPFRLYEAALFQWINPKALLMTISAAGAYVALADGPSERAFLFVATFVVFGAPCGLAWIFAGGALKRVMADGQFAGALNIAISLLLVATIALIAFG
jgi:threonine/homoserine/homoserine lactone efflux protein